MRKDLEEARDEEVQEREAVKRLLNTPDGKILHRILLRDVLMSRRAPSTGDAAMFLLGRNDLAQEIMGMADDG